MKWIFCLALAAGLAANSFAQLPGLTGGAGGIGAPAAGSDFAVLCKIFGTNLAFSAKADVRVVDQAQKEKISLMMDFAKLDEKFRMQMDASKMKNTTLPPGTADGLKQMGMDEVVTLIRPDRKTIYTIFPKMTSYLTTPMEDTESATNKTKMTSEKVGEEKIFGHPCIKNRVTVTNGKGEITELFVWNATDLRYFPLQTVNTQDGDTITTRYTLIQFVRPDAKGFETPAGYQGYDGIQAFADAMMKRLTGGSLPTGLGTVLDTGDKGDK